MMSEENCIVIEDEHEAVEEIVEIPDDDDDQPLEQQYDDQPLEQQNDDQPLEQTSNVPVNKEKNSLQETRGLTKPSYSYCQMITEALASCPGKQATALQICELVANRHPYFWHCTGTWKNSIYSALTKRKKFFMVVGTNPSGEYMWGFNPMFETYMMNKWVPKKLKKSLMLSNITKANQVSLLNKKTERSLPVIVSARSLCSETKTVMGVSPMEPEFALAEPWEPIVTVTEDPDTEEDFSITNWTIRKEISNQEATYRVKFFEEHPNMLVKFRLHCTVCDCHLGFVGSEAKLRLRLHPCLGVLTCNTCYKRIQGTHSKASVGYTCAWCSQVEGTHFFCSFCPYKFCEKCFVRNFGPQWRSIMAGERARWHCFLCDNKLIWPHRAIANHMLRRYRQMKGKQMLLTKGIQNAMSADELIDFEKDISVCCKKSTVTSGDLSLIARTRASVDKLDTVTTQNLHTQECMDGDDPVHIKQSVQIAPRLSESQKMIIEKQAPGHIYVQAPSLTLNTGTQYIHNVYPDNNYVVLQPQSTSNSLEQPTITIHHRPKYIPPAFVDCSDPLQVYSGKLIKTDTDISSTPDEDDGSVNNAATVQNVHILPRGMLVANRIDESELMIVPDQPQELIIPEKEQTDIELSVREKLKAKIQTRPMPKSKKQSLLRSVLMSESIESMKKQLQAIETISSPPIDVPTNVTSEPHEADKNIEEPILKSIIQSATERLLSIQQKTVVAQDNTSDIVDLSHEIQPDTGENSVTSSEIHVPKIKIKDLKELQEIDNNIQNPIIDSKADLSNNSPSEPKEEPKSKQSEQPESEMVSSHPVNSRAVEVNITGLKQGIIEASRTLVSTQKNFKELAKVISSNLSYHTDQAVNLVTKFQQILKSCSKQIEEVDRKVKNQYRQLISNNDIDSILKSIKISSGENNNHPTIRKRKIKRYTNHTGKRIATATCFVNKEKSGVWNSDTCALDSDKSEQQLSIPDEMENSYFVGDGSIQGTRDSVDFNPLGRKVILGTPEVTIEDLERYPDNLSVSSGQAPSAENVLPQDSCNPVMKELLKRQNILRNSVRKRCIWDTKRRKSVYRLKGVKYNKDGSVQKRKGRPPKKTWQDDIICSNREPKLICDPRLRIRPQKRPLRWSERKRSSSDCIISYLPDNYVIKPCSVVVDKLSDKIVRLLEMRLKEN